MERGPIVLVWFLVISAGAVALMIGVAISTRKPPLAQADVTKMWYAIRRYWLIALIIAIVVSFLLSLPWFPYPVAAQYTELQHYAVVAQQFSFQLPSTVPLNKELMFDVTSKDVNHGFGIYDPNDSLVAQVQAMPGYTNHLPVRFVLAGRYTIRCLEYCGIAHHAMQAAFEVR